MDTYEKKYKEALERAKEIYHRGYYVSGDIEHIFPELAESEDERIRKRIYNYINVTLDDNESEEKEKWLTWLEKQGEKPQGKTALDAINEEIVDNANKVVVEPKFKVGDFILNDYCMGKVIEVTNDAYLLDSGQGIPFSCEHNAHLWTLEDAKDGDVLYFSDDTIVIFKDLYNATTFHSYCHIEDGVFDISKDDMPDWWEGKGFYPATKEQRDILFAKMKEAGYEWDAEKKEPKLLVTNGGDFESGTCEQKTAWSREDEERLQSCLNILQAKGIMGVTETVNTKWLKSLKDRYTWKPGDKQLDALHDAALYVDKSMFPYPKGILMKLYKQLKKLKGE